MSGRPDPDLLKGWCPGALRPMMARDGLLVRLKVTGGIVPAETALAIADLAQRHGNGLLDLSARANLQLRGVREASLPALLDGLDELDLLDTEAEAEAVRNVLANPLAGSRHPPPRSGRGAPREALWRGRPLPQSFRASGSHEMVESEARLPPPPPAAGLLPRCAEEDLPDIRALVTGLEAALVADSALHALPPKFGFLVDDGGAPSLAGIPADVRFDWCPSEQAFAVGLGGGTASDALALGFVAPDDLVTRAVALARRTLACPGGPQRLRKLIGERGRAEIAAWFGAHEPASAPASGHPQVVGLRSLRGFQTLGVAAPFGRLDAAMLRAAAAVAAETSLGELRLTPWRVLLIPHAAAAPRDLLALSSAGFIVDPADPRLRVAACTGILGCARGTTDTQADAAALADLAAALPGGGVSLHVSGCAKGCARPRRTATTLVGREGRYDLVRDGIPGDAPVLRSLDVDGARRALRAA